MFRSSYGTMEVSIDSISIERHDISTRMPFKYGIATMIDLPHIFFRITANFDGRKVKGISADHLPPKWFTKDPYKDPRDEINEMLRVIENAGQFAQGIQAESVFAFWHELYMRQAVWAEREELPSLLAHFGTSLVERALIDAFCRFQNQSFSALLRSNAFGIHWDELRPELVGYEPKDLLPAEPLRRIAVRHTVGLTDYLLDSDIPEPERLDDGLPQSLESCIRFYGTKQLKIKVNGQYEQDVARLKSICKLLVEQEIKDFAITIDGNEQFKDVGSFRCFWETLLGEAEMTRFLASLLFVEQPFHRDITLEDPIGVDLKAWTQAPPIIIDESDDALEALPRALELGYRGTSHKNCKGIFKSILNRAVINLRNRKAGAECYLMSGEDLSNIGPIANHQDLVVQAALGNESVERNGHHYFKGLSVFNATIQEDALSNFPNLYAKEESGYVRLNLQNGRIETEDLLRHPFGIDDSCFL